MLLFAPHTIILRSPVASMRFSLPPTIALAHHQRTLLLAPPTINHPIEFKILYAPHMMLFHIPPPILLFSHQPINDRAHDVAFPLPPTIEAPEAETVLCVPPPINE